MQTLQQYGHWKSTGEFRVAVAGTASYREAIEAIACNPFNSRAMVICLAYLVPDDQNDYDPSAVRVVIEGRTVGYLPRPLAREYRSWIQDVPAAVKQVSAAAAITNGLRTADTAYEYSIELDIPEDLTLQLLPESMASEPTKGYGYGPLRHQDDGSFVATVWIPANREELDKRLQVREWTTEAWDTVNFYASNRQRIGLGFKIYEMPKDRYAELFRGRPLLAALKFIRGRMAELQISTVQP